MDANKFILIYFTMKDFFLINQFIIPTNYTFIFQKLLLPIMMKSIFKTWWIFLILVAYPKNLQDCNLASQNKNNMHKIQNKVTCKGIEP